MYQINIAQLTFKCIIGILPSERKTPQRVVVDISFNYVLNDNDFIDYSLIVNQIKDTMIKQGFYLLEDAISYMSKNLNNDFDVNNLTIKITKPDIIQNCLVSVQNKYE